METVPFLKDAISQVPALVVLVIIVVYFLKFLDGKDKRDQMDFDKRDAILKDIAEKAFLVYTESNKVIVDNSKVIGEIREVIRKCSR